MNPGFIFKSSRFFDIWPGAPDCGQYVRFQVDGGRGGMGDNDAANLRPLHTVETSAPAQVHADVSVNGKQRLTLGVDCLLIGARNFYSSQYWLTISYTRFPFLYCTAGRKYNSTYLDVLEARRAANNSQ